MNYQENLLHQIEKKFINVTNLDLDLSQYPLDGNCNLQIKNKKNSDKYGEVFTPLWLVDQMLSKVSIDEWKRYNLTTHDLCAGYGQFTVRMLRHRYNIVGEKLNIEKILNEYHLFSEIQIDSCFKLLYIFGLKIRLLIGDVSMIYKLPENIEKGIWMYSNNQWKNITKLAMVLFHRYNRFNCTINEKAINFKNDCQNLGLSV